MVKKGFSLLEVTVSIFIMGLTVIALLNILEWSNVKYNLSATAWKERTCLTEARIWLREQITNSKESNLNLKNLTENVNCPIGFGFNDLKITKQDNNTFLIRIEVYQDKNRNGKADTNETTARLFCFRKRSA